MTNYSGNNYIPKRHWLVVFTLISSFFVIIEPSPFDMLVVAMFFGAALRGFLVPPSYSWASIFFILMFVTGNALSTISAVDAERVIWYLGVSVYMLFIWYIFSSSAVTRGKDFITSLFLGYAIAAIVSVVVTMLAFWGLVPWGDLLVRYGGRATGFFKDPNVFGPFLVPPAIYGISRVEQLTKSLPRLGWALTSIVCTIGVFISFSRGAWANLLAATIIYIAVRTVVGGIAIRKSIALVALAGMLAGSGFFLFDSMPQFSDMFQQRFRIQQYDDDRFATQHEAFETAMTNPLGIGPGQSELTYDISTHSLYFRILGENGYIGLFSFLGLTFIAVIRLIKNIRSGHGFGQSVAIVCLASIVGVLINSLVIDSLHWRHFWILLALPWGDYDRQGEQSEENREEGQQKIAIST